MVFKVAIVIGSKTDLDAVRESNMLDFFKSVGVTWTVSVISAHRNPNELAEYCSNQSRAGTQIFIGVAGRAAALPGAMAAVLGGTKPVLGVGLSSSNPLDSLAATLSQICMPRGRSVMFCGLDKDGLYNAALAACSILALQDEHIRRMFEITLREENKPPQLDILTFQASWAKGS